MTAASALASSATSRARCAGASCPAAPRPSRASAARTGSTSRASAMTAWSIAQRAGPAGAAPSTTISWPISSMPAEAEARDEASERSRPIAPSLQRRRPRPAPMAMPSAGGGRATGPWISACRAVAHRAPRALAAAIRSAVRSGHFTWTKCTSAGSAMPASRIAARTPSATDHRPGPGGRAASGGRSAVWAWPMARAPGSAGPSASRTSKTMRCGDSPPSVPPDITRQTRVGGRRAGMPPEQVAAARGRRARG